MGTLLKEQAAEKIKELYEISAELERLFPGRHYTPDGHMIGSIGEALAASYYGLELFPASEETHDAKAPDGRLVQIKATQINRISLTANQGGFLFSGFIETALFLRSTMAQEN